MMIRALRNRADSIVWWVRRPQLYREALRVVSHRIFPRLRDPASPGESRAARAWCDERSLDTLEATHKVTGTPSTEQAFRHEHGEVLAEAARRQEACPVRMGGGGNIHLLYCLAEHAQATRVVETGVAYGWSSLALLLSLRKRPGSLLISTDRPYPRTESERWAGCVVPKSYRENWLLIQTADREALPKAMARLPELDLCHYDSDKGRSGKRWAYRLLWASLRPGGIFVSDDIGNDLEFRRFCDAVGIEPTIVRTLQRDCAKEVKFVGIATKPD